MRTNNHTNQYYTKKYNELREYLDYLNGFVNVYVFDKELHKLIATTEAKIEVIKIEALNHNGLVLE